MVKVIFCAAEGDRRWVCEAEAGDTVLEVAHRNGIGIEGACEGQMACSTCHVLVDPAFFERLPRPSEEEEDMLDLALGLAPTSRLGCQIVVSEALDGLLLTLPRATHNMLRIRGVGE